MLLTCSSSTRCRAAPAREDTDTRRRRTINASSSTTATPRATKSGSRWPTKSRHAALDLHGEDPEFGYRLLTDELHHKGFTASENRVWRLCSQQRIFSVHSRKRGMNRKPGPPVHDDLLERDFTAETVNSKWLTDITEHPTGEGKLYLCAIKDCASNKIVGYSLDARMTSELAVAALRNAIALRSPQGTTVHSDRGSQFRSRKYVLALTEAGLVGSMGRVAACLLTG